MGRRKTSPFNSRKTTWSVSEEIDDKIHRLKARRETIDEALNRLLNELEEHRDIQKKENDEETQHDYAMLYEKSQQSIEVYIGEINSILFVLGNHPDTKKFEHYIERLTVLIKKGPIALQKLDQEKQSTGKSQHELIQNLLV